MILYLLMGIGLGITLMAVYLLVVENKDLRKSNKQLTARTRSLSKELEYFRPKVEVR